MDDALIRKILCGRCLAKFDATLEHQTALARAREAKAKLEALENGGPLPGMRSVIARAQKGLRSSPDLDDAIATTKQKLGLPTIKSLGAAHSTDVRTKPVPRERLIACIRGDVSPSDLAAELGMSGATLTKSVNALIGPNDGESWKIGVGHMRGGKRAIELLARKDKEIAVAAVASEFPTKTKIKSKRGRTARQVSDRDLTRLINKRIKIAELAAKYKISEPTIYKQAAELRERFGIPSPRQRAKGDDAQLEMTEAEMRIENIPAQQLDLIVRGKRNVAQVARTYRVTEVAVKQRLSAYRQVLAAERNAKKHATSSGEVSAIVGDKPTNGIAPDPSDIVAQVLGE